MKIQNEYGDKEECWGLLTSIDGYNCDRGLIRDEKYIKQYVIDLCDLIKMKRFGECNIVYFGKDESIAGFSMTQLIETSLISGHFANATNAFYIDIFSCSFYDSQEVAEFTKKYFLAEKVTINAIIRK